MRSTRRLNTTKSTYRHKVNKRRYKSSSSLGCTPCVSILDIENINEVLRVHKSQRAEGKSAWKVVPKDSCEVYKDRRKRQGENNHHDDDANMRTSDSDHTSSRNKKNKKTRKEAVRKTRKRRKPKRRRETISSVSSFTTTTSCMSSSEMDYEYYD